MATSRRLNSRRMLFTLYGDYVYHFGREIWVGSLIRLMQCFGVGEQSVRSELMRMYRQGYLQVRRSGKRSFYSLSPRGREVIEMGARRIFTHARTDWDGRWTVFTYSIPEEQREARDRLRRDLTWSGFGSLSAGVYLNPWQHAEELQPLVERYSRYGYLQIFRADNVGPEDSRGLVARCWDLARVGAAYREFLAEWEPALQAFHAGAGADPSDGGADPNDVMNDEACFVERYLLAHSYEQFPLLDPGLPRELVPADWPGHRAAAVFNAYHDRLQPAAMRFFGSVYAGWPGESPAP